MVVQVVGVDAGAEDADDIAFLVMRVRLDQGLVRVEGFAALVGCVEVVGDLVLRIAVHGGWVVFVVSEVVEHGKIAGGRVFEVALGESLGDAGSAMGEFGDFGVGFLGWIARAFGGGVGCGDERTLPVFLLEDREEVVLLAGEDFGPEEDEGDGDPEGVPAEVGGVGGAVVGLEGLGEEVDDDPETDEPPGGGHEDLDEDEEPEDLDFAVGEQDEERAGDGGDRSGCADRGVV